MFLGAYVCCLLWLLPQLSLSLDELLDLLTLRSREWVSITEAIPRNRGGAPLGYYVRWGALELFGFSPFAARLPSALFSLGACAGVYALALRLRFRYAVLPAALFALLPLQLRYALEARAYAQALCLSVWATVAFFWWLDRHRSIARGFVYGLCVLAGLYTQPYSAFVPVTHWLWLCFSMRHRSMRMPIYLGLAIFLAAIAFVPWYVYGSRVWGALELSYARSNLGLESGLLILREISGSGYLGAVMLISGVVLGLRSMVEKRDRLFWVLYLLVPIAAALAFNVVFGYFLAIRQMIFVLVPLALLAGLGADDLLKRSTTAGVLLLAALFGSAVYGDVRFWTRPRENWEAGARILRQNIGDNGCVLFAPIDSADLYTYFDGKLSSRLCGDIAQVNVVAVAISPYGGDASTIARDLPASQWSKISDLNPDGPHIEIYRRHAPR